MYLRSEAVLSPEPVTVVQWGAHVEMIAHLLIRLLLDYARVGLLAVRGAIQNPALKWELKQVEELAAHLLPLFVLAVMVRLTEHAIVAEVLPHPRLLHPPQLFQPILHPQPQHPFNQQK